MTYIIEFLLVAAVAIAAFWACYVLAFPALVVLGVAGTGTLRTGPPNRIPAVIVIVPAHNMENVIGRCIESLKTCRYPQDKFDVHVVADHCTDATSERARVAGASLLVREVEPRGKTYTLAWALEALAARDIDPDLYVIVDATVRVDPGFLEALARRALQGEDIIVGHAVVDPENQQWFAQCLGLSLSHRNLQNRSRDQLGLSSLIEGRCMGYSRRYIRRHGWSLALPDSTRSGSHPTEDWRHGVRAVEQGWRVAYANQARVFTPLRQTLGAATQQGIRWERGRVSNAVTYGLRLLLLGLRQRSRLKIFAALDAIQPPVAVLGGFCVAVAAFAVAVTESRAGVILGLVPLTLVGLYALAVIGQGRQEGISPRMILWAPVYVAWRCLAFVTALGFVDRSRAAGQRRKIE